MVDTNATDTVLQLIAWELVVLHCKIYLFSFAYFTLHLVAKVFEVEAFV